MSYGSNPKRRGGGGMFFLIILAVGGFLLFSNISGRSGDPQGGAGVLDLPAQSDGNFQFDEDEYLAEQKAARKKMPTTGGTGAAGAWDMDTNAAGSRNPSSGNANATNGDWSMGDADKNETQFKFSNKPGQSAPKSGGDWANTKEPSKKTQNGDWGIEGVDPNKGNDSKFKFSNPTGNPPVSVPGSGGDWKIEDAGSKKN